MQVRRWDLRGDELVAGRHYPRSWQEFEAWFPNDDAARQYLTEMRWFDGFVCPTCGETGARRSEKGWWCPTCRKWMTLTAGTVFASSRIGLRNWLAAVWLLTNEKTGVSARSIERGLGVNYETAWNMLHKLRHVFNQSQRDKLSGLVEIDETYVGGENTGFNRRGRSTTVKSVVIVACEVRTGGKKAGAIGRIRMGVLPNATKAAILPWVQEHVASRTAVHTDGWAAYNDLKGLGYKHRVSVMNDSGTVAHVVFPRVHRVAALFKRWLLGTHQGGVHPQYLDRYVDEFVFRFNRRLAENRGLLFYRVLEEALEPGTNVTAKGLKRPKLRRRPGAMVTAAEQETKLADLEEQQLLDWFEEQMESEPAAEDPFF